jgi:hypothetical protein
MLLSDSGDGYQLRIVVRTSANNLKRNLTVPATSGLETLRVVPQERSETNAFSLRLLLHRIHSHVVSR